MSLKHKARCKDCKAAVLRMLQGFATVTPGWRSGWTTHIDEILRDPANPGRVLSEIYNALVPYRGFDPLLLPKGCHLATFLCLVPRHFLSSSTSRSTSLCLDG